MKNLEVLRRAVVDSLAGNAGCFEVVVRPGVREGTVEISVAGSEECVCSEREDERPDVVAGHLARAMAEAHLGTTAA